MQIKLSCGTETALPRALHQCSRPLQCRALKAAPSTLGQRRRSHARLRTSSKAAGTGPSARGPSGSKNAGADSSKPVSNPALGEKVVEVKVYNPSGTASTEKRTVKIDKVEAAAVQRYSAEAREQSKRLQEANARTDAKAAVDDAADAAQGVTNQLADGISEAADQVQEGADQFEQDAQEVVDDLEETFENAADAAGQKLANAADQVQGAAQGAADSASNFVESLQKGAQTGSPYKTQPLSSMEPSPYEGKSGRKPSAETQAGYFKLRLLECIAGLDRGLAADGYAAMQVESAALALTEQSEPISLSWTPASGEEEKPSGLAQLSGTWRLVYSSGFASGGLGGRQPGPPTSLLPGKLGQVYQVISPYTSRLDNVLEVYTGLPGLEPVVVTASLKHHFEAVGGNIVQIMFEDTEVKLTGGIGGLLGNLPEIMVPQLPEPFKPSRQQRTSSFDILYLDSDMRITRGSRGELRIFVKT